MFEIIELQQELNQIREERQRSRNLNGNQDQIRARMAKAEKDMRRDISYLLREGSDPYEIAEILEIPVDTVRMHIAKVQSERSGPGHFRDLFTPQQGGTLVLFS